VIVGTMPGETVAGDTTGAAVLGNKPGAAVLGNKPGDCEEAGVIVLGDIVGLCVIVGLFSGVIVFCGFIENTGFVESSGLVVEGENSGEFVFANELGCVVGFIFGVVCVVFEFVSRQSSRLDIAPSPATMKHNLSTCFRLMFIFCIAF
jgi:hypothetical protein